MKIRRVRPGEEPQLRRLFYETVHEVNSRDYTPEQLAVWAPEEHDAEAWRKRIAANRPFVCLAAKATLVGEAGDVLAGFADVQPNGYIDQFFVHHAWQRRGVGRALMQAIHAQAETWNLTELISDVSITARPFFEAWDFVVVQRQEVERAGITLTNFRMQKQLG